MRKTIFLSLLLLLPACKAFKTDASMNLFLDVASVVTQHNLRQLFPDVRIGGDSVNARATFAQEDLRKVFNTRARHFFTPEGHLEGATRDFFARLQWQRTGERVEIGLQYFPNKTKRDSL